MEAGKDSVTHTTRVEEVSKGAMAPERSSKARSGGAKNDAEVP